MKNEPKTPQKPKTGSRKKTQVRSKSGTYSAKLTEKQKAFADYKLSNPKASNTEAALKAYNTTDRATAGVLAHQNLKNTNVIHYLETNRDKAQQVITEFMELSDSPKLGEKRLAYDSATQVLDRTIGKPTQKTEVTGGIVTLNLTLEDLE